MVFQWSVKNTTDSVTTLDIIIMIEITKGDLLKQYEVDAIVNTVNCVGVMGKGIALQFKKKWPANFKAYAAACKTNEVKLGEMFIFDLGQLATPRFIINFPTKGHWKSKSRLIDIKNGMADLIKKMTELKIKSIAVPPLGCGNGGLDWGEVREVIEKAFEDAPNIEVKLFEPSLTASPVKLEDNSTTPNMTPGRAAILALLEAYRDFDYGLSKIEVQKLAYFLQEAGENLKLNFLKSSYGPYADQLRHALNRMDGHYIEGVGDGVVDSEIRPKQSAVDEAREFLINRKSSTRSHIEAVETLIEDFQSPYGMELLSTVHWVCKNENAIDKYDALAKVQNWNSRKKYLMKDAHVFSAWERLKEHSWI